jgi:hypothetical protein
MSKALVDLRVRLPRDAKEFVEAEARSNASSQNSEIVRAIRAAMKAKGSAGAATPPSRGHQPHLETKADEHLIA